MFSILNIDNPSKQITKSSRLIIKLWKFNTRQLGSNWLNWLNKWSIPKLITGPKLNNWPTLVQNAGKTRQDSWQAANSPKKKAHPQKEGWRSEEGRGEDWQHTTELNDSTMLIKVVFYFPCGMETCVCVCVRERERERERVCVCVSGEGVGIVGKQSRLGTWPHC